MDAAGAQGLPHPPRRAHGIVRREETAVSSGQIVEEGQVAVEGENQNGVLTVTSGASLTR